MFLAMYAENLPRTCRDLVDADLRSLSFCGLPTSGRDLPRRGGAAVVPPQGGLQLNPPPPNGRAWRAECKNNLYSSISYGQFKISSLSSWTPSLFLFPRGPLTPPGRSPQGGKLWLFHIFGRFLGLPKNDLNFVFKKLTKKCKNHGFGGPQTLPKRTQNPS